MYHNRSYLLLFGKRRLQSTKITKFLIHQRLPIYPSIVYAFRKTKTNAIKISQNLNLGTCNVHPLVPSVH